MRSALAAVGGLVGNRAHGRRTRKPSPMPRPFPPLLPVSAWPTCVRLASRGRTARDCFRSSALPRELKSWPPDWAFPAFAYWFANVSRNFYSSQIQWTSHVSSPSTSPNLPECLGIRDFFDIVAKMKHAISLGVGEPDFDTPWHIREAGIYALGKGQDAEHTSNLGLTELRRAISRYVEEELRRQLRAGKRGHHHRRCKRGAGHRVPRARESRRQGDVSSAVLRQLFAEHHARPRPSRARADVRQGRLRAHRGAALRAAWSAGLQYL